MTALEAARNTPILGAGGVPVKTSYPVADDAVIWPGALVAITTAGYLVPASAISTLKVVGFADPSASVLDNTDGGDGGLDCAVIQGVGRLTNGNSITLSSVGGLVYAVDDQTVSTSSAGSTRPLAGTVYLVDDEGVWFYAGIAAPLDASTLTTFISDLAAITAGEGASLVGVEDQPNLLAGATVEAALIEIVKKANAALCVPVACPVTLANAITGAVLLSFKAQAAGKISALDASATATVTTASKSAILQAYISGVAVTGATLTLTSAALTSVGNRVSGIAASGTNSFTAGQIITVAVLGTPVPFAEGAIDLQMFLASA